jgi:hypothetical protein
MIPSRLLILQRRKNLFRNSEGVVATAVSSSGVTDAATSIAGFDASIQFPAGGTLALLFRTNTLSVGAAYTLSVYVQMDDGSAPDVRTANNAGDFSMQTNNGIAAASTVNHLGGSLYRITTPFVSTGYASSGVIRYAAQSGKAFRITGMQVNKGLTAASYQKTGA